MGYAEHFNVQDEDFNKAVRNAWIVINILLISLVAFDLLRSIYRNSCSKFSCCKADLNTNENTNEKHEEV